MADKGYNAGTIFLQVVPVFGDTINAIRREVQDANKALGRDMEAGGRDAGRRGAEAMAQEMSRGGDQASQAFAKSWREGMRRLNRDIRDVKMSIGVDDTDALEAIDKIQTRAQNLRDKKIGLHLDTKEAMAQFATIDKQLENLGKNTIDLKVHANLKNAHAQTLAFIEDIEKYHPEINAEVNFKEARAELGNFEKKFSETSKRAAKSLGTAMNPEIRKVKDRLNDLSVESLSADFDSTAATAELKHLQAELVRLGATETDIAVKANVGDALVDLGIITAIANQMDGRDIEMDVNVDRKGSIGDASDNFRALNGILVAVLLTLPMLIPLVAALGGAFLALGPAIAGVGAGLGTMLLGFSGIGAAVKGLAGVSKNAAKDQEAASKTMRNAARGVADAERTLGRARQDAAASSANAQRAYAQTVEDVADRNKAAARAVEDAERSAAQGVQAALRQRADAVRAAARADRDAAQAQRDLVQARQEARADLDDTKDNAAQLALDERQGVVDLFEATVADQQVRQDGSATNLEKEQAAITLEQARLRLEEIREQRAETEKQVKAGINGTQRVQSAQDAVVQAIERQRDAHRAVGEASAAVDRARVDGARQVADALRAQRETQLDGQQAIADAARNRAETEAQGARAIGDAQRNLARAQEDYRDALRTTSEVGSTSMQELEDAMGKLSPAGRKFARFLFSLRKGFYEIRALAQQGMLPGVQAGMEAVINRYSKSFPNFVSRMSKANGDLFRSFGKMLTSPLWAEFFGMVDRLGPKFVRLFGKTTMNWFSVFARILTIAAPWAEKFSKALLRVSQNALGFTKSRKGTKVITDFLRYSEKVGPKVWRFFKDLWAAVVNIGKALAPVGELLMAAVSGMLRLIAAMNPKALGALLVLLGGAVLAFQAMNSVIALASVGLRLFFVITKLGIGPWVLWLGVIILVVAAIVALYTQSDTFRRIVHKALKVVGDVAMWLWKRVLIPAFKAIGRAVVHLWKTEFVPAFRAIGRVLRVLGGVAEWLWRKVIKPVFGFIGRIVMWLWKNAVKPYIGFVIAYWKVLGAAFRFVWRQFLKPVFDLFGHIVKFILWRGILKPIFWVIKTVWEGLSKDFRKAWRDNIKPAIDAFGDRMRELRKTFRTVVDALGKIWEGLKAKMRKPINFVINTVLNNGLIAGFNKVAKFVGSDSMPKLREISAATGGILPGYTPGRDVHHFVSPTGGRLNLSGGEPIMRPEFGKVVGKDWVDQMNSAARRYGTAGVKRQLGYATGGIYHPNAVNSFKTGSNGGSGGMYWPTVGRRTSTYRNHDGVDINQPPGPNYGAPIYAWRDGRITYVGSSRGYGAPAIFQKPVGYPEVVYGHAASASVRKGQMARAGQVIGRVGATGSNVNGAHLHFGVPGGTYEQAMALLRGGKTSNAKGPMGDAGGGVSLPRWLQKIVGTPVKWLMGLAEKGVDKIKDTFGNNPFLGALASTTKKVGRYLMDKFTDATDKAQAQASTSASGSTPNGIGGLGPAAVRAVKAVRSVFDFNGTIGGYVYRNIAGTSQLSKHALGKAIDVMTYSNMGLGQRIANYFVRNKGKFGVDNVIFNRRIHNARGWHGYSGVNPHTDHPHIDFFRDGGIYQGSGSGGKGEGGSGETGTSGVANNGTMMYDKGGYLPPGITQVVNLTGKPEPVFTAQQFASLGSGSGSSGGGPTYAYSPTFHQSDLTADDVAKDMLYGFRVLNNRGKYGGPQ